MTAVIVQSVLRQYPNSYIIGSYFAVYARLCAFMRGAITISGEMLHKQIHIMIIVNSLPGETLKFLKLVPKSLDK